MKRLLTAFILGLTTLFLVACSNQNSFDGEYYWISENRNELILTITDGEGVLESEGTHSVEINTDSKTFEIEGFSEPTVSYEYKDGVLTANLTGVERDYYKKGTDAYKEALEKYGYSDDD